MCLTLHLLHILSHCPNQPYQLLILVGWKLFVANCDISPIATNNMLRLHIALILSFAGCPHLSFFFFFAVNNESWYSYYSFANHLLGIYPDIAGAKLNYWSSLAPLPVEIVMAAGQKAKEDSHSGEGLLLILLVDTSIELFYLSDDYWSTSFVILWSFLFYNLPL